MICKDSFLPRQIFRAMIVDDHELLREGVKAVFHGVPWVRIVGEAPTIADAFAFLESARPDLIMLDPLLSGEEAITSINRIRSVSEHTRIMVICDSDVTEWVYECLDAGVRGYLMKKSSSQELLMGVRAVLEGETYLSPNVIMSVARGIMDGRRPSDTAALLNTLTSREREVFHLAGQGVKNREISDQLFISIKTVEKHRANMMAKLRLKGAAQLRRLWSDSVASS